MGSYHPSELVFGKSILHEVKYNRQRIFCKYLRMRFPFQNFRAKFISLRSDDVCPPLKPLECLCDFALIVFCHFVFCRKENAEKSPDESEIFFAYSRLWMELNSLRSESIVPFSCPLNIASLLNL